jgi:hypothetical protein
MGSFKLPKVMTPTQSYSARSAHLWRVGHAASLKDANLPLPLPWTGAPSRAREEVVEKYPGVKKGR